MPQMAHTPQDIERSRDIHIIAKLTPLRQNRSDPRIHIPVTLRATPNELLEHILQNLHVCPMDGAEMFRL